VDGRKRFCSECSKLSYFVRWHRIKKAKGRIVAEFMRRLAPKPLGTASHPGTPAAVELGKVLSWELARQGINYADAADAIGVPKVTLFNWVSGHSLPRNRGDFVRLQDLGLKPVDLVAAMVAG